MRTFSYIGTTGRGVIKAESPFKAAQVILNTKQVLPVVDQFGVVYTNPFKYTGAVIDEKGNVISNPETKIWESK